MKEQLETISKLISFTHNMNLLYVEDNEDIRNSTMIFLEDLFGNITIAVNGEDALNKFCTDKFDLIITDGSMPKLDGFGLSKAVRQQDSKIPILMIAALDTAATNKDITAFISKPIDAEEFIHTLFKIVKK